MTGPREWRHAVECPWLWSGTCTCGLSAVRDAIAAGHRVVIGPDGVEGRLAGQIVAYTPDASDLAIVVPLEEP